MTKLADGAPQTSIDAAALVAPATGTQRDQILEAIGRRLRLNVHADGLTDEEISNLTKIKPNSARPRRVELVEGGWLTDSGSRRNGSTVWTFTETGRAIFAPDLTARRARQFCSWCGRTTRDYSTERFDEPRPLVWHTCNDFEACATHRARNEIGGKPDALPTIDHYSPTARRAMALTPAEVG